MGLPYSRIAFVLVVFTLAGRPGGRFRGGKKRHRDQWYGLEHAEGFDDFRRWWHREGKDEQGGADLRNAAEAQAAYHDWLARGRPKVK